MHSWRPRLMLAAIPPLIAGAVFAGMPLMQASATVPHRAIYCQTDPRCLEVQDWKDAGFEYYVGHDEPSMLFYSNRPGSGNNSTYRVTLPTEPVAQPDPAGKTPTTWDFQLHPAFWFGMIICNPDSYPNVTKTCVPNSDTNIKPLAQAAGQAFLELQFYPPGSVATSCTAKRWCVAMVIWSLAEDPIHGTTLNAACTGQIGGLEYPNLAYLTKSGTPTGPPNPIDLNGNSFTVTNDWLLMNQGDQLTVAIHDSADGLQTVVKDLTTNTVGSMTASAKNGFGTVDYQPTGSACNLNPYNFHPEFSTSQPPLNIACPPGVFPNNAAGGNSTAAVCTDQGGTRVQWAAHSYNVSYSDEIGHFDWCNSIAEPNAGSSLAPGAGFGSGHCGVQGREGPGLTKHSDADTTSGCYTGEENSNFAKYNGAVAGSDGLGVVIPGCFTQNDGFDGGSYHADRWAPSPNAPTPITFSSPLTGPENNQPYQRVAFEADIPRITALNVTDYDCSRNTGTRWDKDAVTGLWTDTGKPCAVPPLNDTGTTAFYPTFRHTSSQSGETGDNHGDNNCMWQEGNYTASTGGARVQYGNALWKLSYLAFGGGGALIYRFNDVRGFSSTTCSGGDQGDQAAAVAGA